MFRLLKAHTPGPYTYILDATTELPRLLLHTKLRSIGVRVPDHRITHALLEALGEPLMSVTLIPVGEALPMSDPEEIRERFGAHLDLIIDGGACHLDPTSVIDLRELPPKIVREGRGDNAVSKWSLSTIKTGRLASSFSYRRGAIYPRLASHRRCSLCALFARVLAVLIQPSAAAQAVAGTLFVAVVPTARAGFF